MVTGIRSTSRHIARTSISDSFLQARLIPVLLFERPREPPVLAGSRGIGFGQPFIVQCLDQFLVTLHKIDVHLCKFLEPERFDEC
jgi:hypothetical protein